MIPLFSIKNEGDFNRNHSEEVMDVYKWFQVSTEESQHYILVLDIPNKGMVNLICEQKMYSPAMKGGMYKNFTCHKLKNLL